MTNRARFGPFLRSLHQAVTVMRPSSALVLVARVIPVTRLGDHDFVGTFG